MPRALPYPERKPARTWSGLFSFQEDLSLWTSWASHLKDVERAKDRLSTSICDIVFAKESGIGLTYVLHSIRTISGGRSVEDYGIAGGSYQLNYTQNACVRYNGLRRYPNDVRRIAYGHRTPCSSVTFLSQTSRSCRRISSSTGYLKWSSRGPSICTCRRS